MKIFIVGGAVRDKLLGKNPSDIDYVVVGSTPEEMLSLGYEQVGADFPVFLNPDTNDEYALARTERKTGAGYLDFETKFDKTITLEDDLLRRDLTINAMAMDEDGNVIDPFNGMKDLENKVIRHVSEAFKEDPVRVLRVARFMAKMPDFTIAHETKEMLKEMVSNGEVDNLKPDRIWKEFVKAFNTDNPERFINTLQELGALKVILPEIEKMRGVPQRADYHAEGDVYIHTLMVLKEACKLSKGLPENDKLFVRMSALFHDIGKAYTPNHLLYEDDGSIKGHHHGHDSKEIVEPKIREVGKRLRMPKAIEDFCVDVGIFHQKIHQIKKMSPRGITKMFNELSIRQKAGNGNEDRYIDNFMMSCYADALGRKVTVNNEIQDAPKEYPQQDIFRTCFKEYSNCSADLQNWIKTYTERNEKKPEGELIKTRLYDIRVKKLKNINF